MDTKSRSASLDLARFIACMIVFLGHLVFLPKNFEYSEAARRILSPIMVGDTAVLFFFALSGYVLLVRPTQGSGFIWTLRRLLRLYPVYIVAWLSGLFLIYLRSPELLSIKVIILGLFGFQAVDPDISLVVNAPLWSLSVEIIYAFILYYLIKLRSSISILLLIPVGLIAWCIFPWSSLARALTFFIVGIFLRSDRVRDFHFSLKTSKAIFILGTLWFLSFGAYQILKLPMTLFGEIVKILFIAITLFLVSRTEIRESWRNACFAAGERSFCLYAFHYPVLLGFHYFIQPSGYKSLSIYFLCSILVSGLVTEITFRLVDKPAHKLARNYRRPTTP